MGVILQRSFQLIHSSECEEGNDRHQRDAAENRQQKQRASDKRHVSRKGSRLSQNEEPPVPLSCWEARSGGAPLGVRMKEEKVDHKGTEECQACGGGRLSPPSHNTCLPSPQIFPLNMYHLWKYDGHLRHVKRVAWRFWPTYRSEDHTAPRDQADPAQAAIFTFR